MKAAIRIAFLLFSILFAVHQQNYCLAEAEEASHKAGLITLYAGEIKALPTIDPKRVMISQPNIADVTSISKDEMLIAAKAPGTTDLVWWDNLGKHEARLQVFAEDLSLVKERIDSILKELNLPGVYTRSMYSEGKVLLLGSVKAAQDKERVVIASGKLKDKIVDLIQIKEEEAMVEIAVQVLELNKDATTTLGFTWPGSISLTEMDSADISSTGAKWGNLFKILNVNRAAYNWALDALVQEGKARILSEPRLACQSGKEAELLMGGEKPIFTTVVAATTGAQATNVEYKEFGIKLKIKPAVTENKQIKLALNMEVSEVLTPETIGSANSPTAKAYPLTKRNASTELFLNDGQTIAIGGLVKQKTEEDIRKAPFIADVPILGLLFRKKTSRAGGGQGERGDTELFITLTPSIIKEEIREEPNPETPAFPKEEPLTLPQPEVKVEIPVPVQPEAEVAPEDAIKKAEIKPEAKIKKIKAKPAKKIKPKKIKKEKVKKEQIKKGKIKKETAIKEALKLEAEPVVKVEPQVKPVVKAKPAVNVEPEVGIGGGGGVFPKGLITKESLKPEAEAEVKTKVARSKKEKVKKAKKVKKEAKVKVSLKESPSAAKETFKAEAPAPATALTAPALPTAPTLSPAKEEVRSEPAVAEQEPWVSVSVKEAITREETKRKEPSEEEIDADALSKYLVKIAQLIRDNLVYPWVAKQMNIQGSLILEMHLYYTGELLEVKIIQPSGCALLDDDAVRTVKKIAPYPPFPPEIKRKELRIDIPIIYKIE